MIRNRIAMDDPAEDEENQVVKRPKKSDNRRSSILKSNRLSEIDINTQIKTQVTKRISRRVSFAETYVVKEFLTDSPQRWNSEPDIKSESDTSDNIGRENAVPNITDFDKLLTGTIQSQKNDTSNVNVDITTINHEDEPKNVQSVSFINTPMVQLDRTSDKDLFVMCNKSAFVDPEKEAEEKIDSKSFLSQFLKTKPLSSGIVEKSTCDTLLASTSSDDLHCKIDSRSFIEKLESMTRLNAAGAAQSSSTLSVTGSQGQADTTQEMNSKFTKTEQLDKSVIRTRMNVSNAKDMTTGLLIESLKPASSSLTNPCVQLRGLRSKGLSDITQYFNNENITASTQACPNNTDLHNKSHLFDNVQSINLAISDVSHAKLSDASHKKLLGNMEETKAPETTGLISDCTKLCEYSIAAVPNTKTAEVFECTQIFGLADDDAAMDMTCENFTDKSATEVNHTKIFEDTSVRDMTCGNIPAGNTKSSIVDNGHTIIFGNKKDAAVMEMTCQTIPDLRNKSAIDANHTRVFGNSEDTAAMEMTCQIHHDIRNKFATELNNTKIFGNSEDTVVMNMTSQSIAGLNGKSSVVDSGHTIIFGNKKDAATMEMTCQTIPDLRNKSAIDANCTRVFGNSEDTATMEMPCSNVLGVKSAIFESGQTIIFGNGKDATAMDMTCELISDLRNKSSVVEANCTKAFGSGNNAAAMEMTCEIHHDIRNKFATEVNNTKIFDNSEDTVVMNMTSQSIAGLNGKSSVVDSGHTIIFGNKKDAATMEMTCQTIPDLRNKSATDANHTRVFGNSEDTGAMEMTYSNVLGVKSAVVESGNTRIFGNRNDAASMEMTCDLIPDLRNKSAIKANHTKVFGNSEDTAAMEMTFEHIPDLRNKCEAGAEITRTFGNSEKTAAIKLTFPNIADVNAKTEITESGHTIIFGNKKDGAAMEMTSELIPDLRNKSSVLDVVQNVSSLKDKYEVTGSDYGQFEDEASTKITCDKVLNLQNNSGDLGSDLTKIYKNDDTAAGMEITSDSVPVLMMKSDVVDHSRVSDDAKEMELTCQNLHSLLKKSKMGHNKTMHREDDKSTMEMTCQNDAANYSSLDKNSEAGAFKTAWKKTLILKGNVAGRDDSVSFDNDDNTAARKITDAGIVAASNCVAVLTVEERTHNSIPECQEKSKNIHADHTRIFESNEITSAMEMTCQNAIDNNRTRVFGNNDSTAAMEITCRGISDLKEKSQNVFSTQSRVESSVANEIASTDSIVVQNFSSDPFEVAINDGSAVGKNNSFQRSIAVCPNIASSNSSSSLVDEASKENNMPQLTLVSSEQKAMQPQDLPSSSKAGLTIDKAEDSVSSTLLNNTQSVPDPVTLGNTLKRKLYAFDMMMAGAKAKSVRLLNTLKDPSENDTINSANFITGQNSISTTTAGEAEFSSKTVAKDKSIESAFVPITTDVLPTIVRAENSHYLPHEDTVNPQQDSRNFNDVTQSTSCKRNVAISSFEDTCNTEMTLFQLKSIIKVEADRTMTTLITPTPIADEHLDLSVKIAPLCDDKNLVITHSCDTSSLKGNDMSIKEKMVQSDTLLSMDSTSSEERTSYSHLQSMNQSQLNLSKSSSSCPIHERFCKKMDIEHKEWIKIRNSSFMMELEADTLKNILKIQTLTVPKYEMTEKSLIDLKEQEENLQLDIDNINAAMDETQPPIFDIIEKAEADHTELEELKEKVHSCKSFCWKKARKMWKRQQIKRNTNYITAIQNKRLMFRNILDEILSQIEMIQDVVTEYQKVSTDVGDEIEQMESSRCVEEEKFVEHQQVVQKEKELQECLKETEDILSEKKASEAKLLAVDYEHSRLTDELIKPPDSKKCDEENILTQLKRQLEILNSIHRWELKEQSPTFFVFLFFYGCLELTVMYEANPLQTTNCISLVSYLSDESTPLVKLAVQLILDATDTTKLKEQFSTKDKLPQLLLEVSHIVGNVHTAVDEIDRVSLRNTVDIKEKFITISVRCVSKIRKVSLSFTLGHVGYPLHVADYEIKVHIGNIKVEEIRKHLETVTLGCDYCARLVNAVKHYIQS